MPVNRKTKKLKKEINMIDEACAQLEIEKRYLILQLIEKYHSSGKISKKVYEAIKNRM